MEQEKIIREIIRDEHNRYNREWRAKNKEKVRRYNETYWRRRAEKLLAEQDVSKPVAPDVTEVK